jgi:hypothetical protein
MSLANSQIANSEQSRNLAVSWGIVYGLIWLYRSSVSVVAQSYVAGLTSLGDAGRYQNATFSLQEKDLPNDLVGATRTFSTLFTESIGAVLAKLSGGSPILINIGFQTIAFIGIVVLLRSFEPRARAIMLPFLLLPSFTLWSSVASKEAIVVGALGVGLAGLIRWYSSQGRLGPLHIAALCLVAVYKNQYIPALVVLYFGLWAAMHVSQKALIVLLGGLISAVFIVLFADNLGTLALLVVPHFVDFGSSRPAYFVNVGDFVSKAPYGMFQAFFGPTVAEAGTGILQLAAFVESTAILAVLGVVVLIRLPTMSVFQFFIGSLTVFWVLFATYPLGIMNAGSAVRYRTGYEMLVLVVIIFFTERKAFMRWLRVSHGTSETRILAADSSTLAK